MTPLVALSRRRFVGACATLSLVPWRDLLAASACTKPVTNILGPAYRNGAPLRTRLCEPDEPGIPLAMSGRIVAAGSCKPLSGVLLDVWQVDANGDYDMESPAFHLRGKFKCGNDGRYAFDTIRPVPYGVRPKHIHYLVTCEGYEPRITQCYFAGDERNATDHYVKPELIITPRPRGKGNAGALDGVFDIALERERRASADDVRAYPDYAGDYEVVPGVFVTIRADGRRLRWHLSEGETPGDALDGVLQPRSRSRFFIPEYDLHLSFVRDEHGNVTHTLDERGHVSRRIQRGG